MSTKPAYRPYPDAEDFASVEANFVGQTNDYAEEALS
jgi:hypothetical protein